MSAVLFIECLIAARRTHREDLKAVAAGVQASGPAEFVSEGDEFGDVDGFDLAGVEVDEEVVGRAAVDKLVVGLVFVEEDALDDAGILEEADGAVDGGLGDAEAPGLDGAQEFLGFKEAILSDNGVEDAGPLRGVLETLGLELAAEDGAEGFDDFEGGVGHGGW